MMRLETREQKQQAALIGLVVVAAVIGVVRFGPKPKPAEAATPRAEITVADLVAAPEFDRRVLDGWQCPPPSPRPFQAAPRDLFRLRRRVRAVAAEDAVAPGEALQLGAVMAGAQGAVARINDAYARVGDQVGAYTVVDIALDSVVLESDDESLVLTLAR